MSNFKETIDDTIEGLRIGMVSNEAHWGSIEGSIRVLEFVRDLGPNLVGLDQDDFEGLVLKAIKGE